MDRELRENPESTSHWNPEVFLHLQRQLILISYYIHRSCLMAPNPDWAPFSLARSTSLWPAIPSQASPTFKLPRRPCLHALATHFGQTSEQFPSETYVSKTK
jgi:hypothetical protein